VVRCGKGVQAKRLRVAQIVLLGGDGQLLHILDGLKVLWRKLETAKHLLIVGMRPEAEGNLVPEPLILNRLNLLVTPIEEIGMGQRWCFSHATGSFLERSRFNTGLVQESNTRESEQAFLL